MNITTSSFYVYVYVLYIPGFIFENCKLDKKLIFIVYLN